MDTKDDELFQGWFEESDLAASEAAPFDGSTDRRSRVGVVIAAVSALAVILVVIFVGRA